MTETLLGLIFLLLAVMGGFLVYRLNQIHVLVNSRLTGLLRDIKSLKERLGIPAAEEPEPTEPGE